MLYVNALIFGLFFGFVKANASSNEAIKYSACCSYPCENNGICISMDDNEVYECDCFNTGHYGKRCETPYFKHRIIMMIKPSQDFKNFFLSNFAFLWAVVNRINFLRHFLLKLVIFNELRQVPEPAIYRGMKSYPTWDSYANDKVYARLLPPIPLNCPTQTGVKGPKTLPSVDEILNLALLRKEFKPDPRHTNLVLPFFNQHFTHEFFHLDKSKGRPYQKEDNAINLSHVYGLTKKRQHELRSHVDGKMKVHIINNEVFPPLINETGNPHIPGASLVPEQYRFLLGHDAFTLMPTFLVFGTLWLREHNRICDILVKKHPIWDDERVFQTARLVMIGVTMQITVGEYVQHLSGYKLQLNYIPELVSETEFSYHNQIHLEFDILYQMHSLVPDYITLNKNQYELSELVFNPEPIVKTGLADTLKTISQQYAGKSYLGENQGRLISYISKQVMEDSRRLRVQPLNNYRKAFGLEPYKSFVEMTGEFILSHKLKELYGDIDAVELYPGLYCENAFPNHIFGKTLMKMISPFAFRGLFSNPIGAAEWWKPSTFGGEELFQLIRETTLQDLICRNMDGVCPKISFLVPEDVAFTPQPELKDGEILGGYLMNIQRSKKAASTDPKMYDIDKLPEHIKNALKKLGVEGGYAKLADRKNGYTKIGSENGYKEIAGLKSGYSKIKGRKSGCSKVSDKKNGYSKKTENEKCEKLNPYKPKSNTKSFYY